MYVKRKVESRIQAALNRVPVVALVGPRQCGKSTLAKVLIQRSQKHRYLDLELPSDLRRLTDPEQYLTQNRESLVCIDEVQRKPDLFPVLRAISDRSDQNGRYLILGSAGPDLLRQSSESLAGRISYVYLTPFQIDELGISSVHDHWMRGGFPRSYLASNEEESLAWRYDFIASYLERDIPALGFQTESWTMRRLITMLAHNTAQLMNKTSIGNALGISTPTLNRYLGILEQTFVIRLLSPFLPNIKKRLIRSPKVFVRDSGVLHALLELSEFDRLASHPVFGHSWESYAVEQIVSAAERWHPFFFRTSNGAEIDLVLTQAEITLAFEFKATLSPKVPAAFIANAKAIRADGAFVVCPFGDAESYPGPGGTTVVSLDEAVRRVAADV